MWYVSYYIDVRIKQGNAYRNMYLAKINTEKTLGTENSK